MTCTVSIMTHMVLTDGSLQKLFRILLTRASLVVGQITKKQRAPIFFSFRIDIFCKVVYLTKKIMPSAVCLFVCLFFMYGGGGI